MKIPPGIDERKNKNGTTYRARCRYKGHKFVSKTFKSLTLAKKWKCETDGLIQQGLYLSHSKAEQHTLAEAIDRYLKEILQHKPKNARNIEYHLERWKREVGHLRLNRVTAAIIVETREKLLSEIVPSGQRRSNTTVVRYLSSLSHVLSTAANEWLWIPKTRFDQNYMNKVLAPDFFEFGRSGKTYSREDTLAIAPQPINAVLPLKNFVIHAIEINVVLITYISQIEHEMGNRSSIWSKGKDGWQLRFHQGTPIN